MQFGFIILRFDDFQKEMFVLQNLTNFDSQYKIESSMDIDIN